MQGIQKWRKAGKMVNTIRKRRVLPLVEAKVLSHGWQGGHFDFAIEYMLLKT